LRICSSVSEISDVKDSCPSSPAAILMSSARNALASSSVLISLIVSILGSTSSFLGVSADGVSHSVVFNRFGGDGSLGTAESGRGLPPNTPLGVDVSGSSRGRLMLLPVLPLALVLLLVLATDVCEGSVASWGAAGLFADDGLLGFGGMGLGFGLLLGDLGTAGGEDARFVGVGAPVMGVLAEWEGGVMAEPEALGVEGVGFLGGF
jgi:hypothetical protein